MEEIYIMKQPKPPTNAEILKTKKNYIKIKFGYSRCYIFPYEEGMGVMQHFVNAEAYDTSDYENPIITPLSKDGSPEMEILSEKMYIDLKMSHLLGAKVEGE